MRYVLIILSSILLSFSAFSQAPGYLGKRFVLGLGTGIKISPRDYLEDDNFDNITSKSKSLGLRFHYFNSYVENTVRYRLSESTYIESDGYDTKTFGIGLDYRIYISDFIAPVGAYWQFSLATFKTSTDDLLNKENKSLFISHYGPLAYKNMEKTNTLYYFGLSRGKTFVLYKYLGFDIAFYAGFSINKYLFSDIIDELDGYYKVRTTIEDIEYSYQNNVAPIIKRRFNFGIRFNINFIP
jgi:hypothetical protein